MSEEEHLKRDLMSILLRGEFATVALKAVVWQHGRSLVITPEARDAVVDMRLIGKLLGDGYQLSLEKVAGDTDNGFYPEEEAA